MHLLAVHILQEEIQRHDALREAAVDALPFRMRQDARDQIERKQPLGSPAVAVYREGDSLNQERQDRQASAAPRTARAPSRRASEKVWCIAAEGGRGPRTSRRKSRPSRSPRTGRGSPSVLGRLPLHATLSTGSARFTERLDATHQCFRWFRLGNRASVWRLREAAGATSASLL